MVRAAAMMDRRMAISLAILVLPFSGCVGGQDVEHVEATSTAEEMPSHGATEPGALAQNETEVTPVESPAIEVLDGEGHITGGVGIAVPGQRPQWAEVLVTAGILWDVDRNVTAMLVELAWNGVAPADLTLGAMGDDGAMTFDSDGSAGLPDAPASLLFEGPAPGKWFAEGFSNGLVVDQTYHIYVTLFRGAVPPVGYSGVPAS